MPTVALVARESWASRLVMRPVTAGLLLLAVYVGLSFAMDPMGALGTDTGGKVATMEVMADRPMGLDPDVGYWAAESDPDAELHGLFYTSRIGDRFVNVTTLPMLELGAPLYRIGGYRAALILPMLGAMAAAFAGRALVRQIGGGERSAWSAFWLLGLASPLVIYALDFWEHAPGVALVMWGTVALLRAVDEPRPWWPALWGAAGGLAFGAAYSMRTEGLVYAFVGTAVVSVYLLGRRRWRKLIENGVGVVVGLVATLLATSAIERAVLGQTFRSGRASGTAEAAGSDLGLRLKEAVITGSGLLPNLDAGSLFIALLLAASLLVAASSAGRPWGRRVAIGAAAAAVALVVVRLTDGLGFVPGMVAATPLAAVGIMRPPSSRNARLILVAALVAMPLVWLFQFTGGAGPQWAGRYILSSGALLLVLGAVGLASLPLWARRFFVGLSVAMTMLGLLWLVERSHEVGRAARDVAAFTEDAVVSTQAFWLRELGAVYEGDATRWLSVRDESRLDAAFEIAFEADVEAVALLSVDSAPDLADAPVAGDFEAVGQRTYDWLGIPWVVTTYERSRS